MNNVLLLISYQFALLLVSLVAVLLIGRDSKILKALGFLFALVAVGSVIWCLIARPPFLYGTGTIISVMLEVGVIVGWALKYR